MYNVCIDCIVYVTGSELPIAIIDSIFIQCVYVYVMFYIDIENIGKKRKK